ncbi:MAG: nucleotidyltransferase family protein [Oscillospiraceae bacterium]|nr:nucleotidyltransferase family protein [Oscillospiraceae bacterium]
MLFLTIAAIICEYNPFHLGHQHQFAAVRRALGADTGIVCLMSGNYVQRGAPAMLDKTLRAEAALRCGANVVLELPVTCAIQSAEGFAMGGVGTLHRLGTIDALCFGCECGDAAPLMAVAEALDSDAFPDALHAHLGAGLSFARARQAAIESLCGLGGYLREPNNILGVEYCKALRRLDGAMRPVAIARNQALPEAGQIRAAFPDGAWQASVPQALVPRYAAAPYYTTAAGERAMLSRLRSMTEADYAALPYGSEGLWRKVMRAGQTEPTLARVIAASLSKRYPRTRLQRMLLCAYLGIDRETLVQPPPYLRILGFDDTGRSILRQMRKKSPLPLVNAGALPPDARYAALERRTEDLFGLFLAGQTAAPGGFWQQRRVIYFKNQKKHLQSRNFCDTIVEL